MQNYDHNKNIDPPWFDWQKLIWHVIIEDGVTSIGKNAFIRCKSLKSVTIPDGVTSIGNCAFYGCTRLTEIKIPVSVTEIGRKVFYDCTSLKTIYYKAGADFAYNLRDGNNAELIAY